MSVECDLRELLVGFGQVAVPHERHGFLHAVGEAVGFIVGEAYGLVIFDACLIFIAHQGVSVAEAKLGAYKIGVHLQRRLVVLERAVELPCHALELAVRVLRIGFIREQDEIAIHRGKRLIELTVARFHVGQIIDCGRKVLVNGQRLEHKVFGLIVSVFSHEPVAREIEQMLVAGIHFEHVVHGADPANEVALLYLGDPGDHQLLAWRGLGS